MHIVLATAFLFDTPWDLPGGGMGEYVIKIAKLLKKANNEVEIVAGALDNKRWQYQGIDVFNAFWYGNLCGNPLQISEAIVRRNIAIQKRIREIDKKNRIDIVQYAGWSGVGMFHSINCPSILRLSTYSKITYAQNVQYKDYVSVYSFWERMAGRSVDRIICPGEKIAHIFEKECKRPVTIVETPVCVDSVAKDVSVFNGISDKPYFLFFGTASKEKGFDVIGNMCLKLFSQNKDIRYVFAGWDEGMGNNSAVHRLREKLALYSDRFIYLGPLEKKRLYPVIEGAEMVLVPSIVDNLPNACLEAMALGKIVIGTTGTALEQLIKDGNNGFLVRPGDSNELFEAAEKVLKMNTEEKKKMSEAILNSIKSYLPENSVNKLIQIYKRELSI